MTSLYETKEYKRFIKVSRELDSYRAAMWIGGIAPTARMKENLELLNIAFEIAKKSWYEVAGL